jgi:hypothetical protein
MLFGQLYHLVSVYLLFEIFLPIIMYNDQKLQWLKFFILVRRLKRFEQEQ